MNWELITRCGVRYTLAYAVLTIIPVFLITRSGIILLGMVCLGILLLLFALGGTGNVRAGTAVANAQALGLQSGVIDPATTQAKAMSSDIKVFFYGIGIILWSMITLVLVG